MLGDYLHELNTIFSAPRNPILAKVLAEQKPENPCEYDLVPKVAGNQIPKFIKSWQHKVPTNSELLNTYYIDCFGAESDMYVFDPLVHNDTTEEGFVIFIFIA